MPKRLRPAVIAAILTLVSSVALAQERSPAQRQTLTDLAYVLGQSHALRQACAGQTDQFWRDRMFKLLQTEAPDPAFDRRLKQAFNTGYAGAQAAFPACDAQTRREEERTAAHGRTLVESLAQP
ncbi:MAG: TIGR02301 family protein [Caulobacteraceae bacterium]|nr:TIGR02301 family protein [Caulobacteraceae bacterium]